MKGNYTHIIVSDLEHVEKLIQELKSKYHIAILQSLKKEIAKIESSSSLYGYLEITTLCHQLKMDLTIKITNFGLDS